MTANPIPGVPCVASALLIDIAIEEGFHKCRFQVTSGSGPTDGFMSSVYRITAQDYDGAVKPRELHLVCKTSLEDSGDLTAAMFAAEAFMYRTVLPAMENIVPMPEPLPWPKCHRCVAEGPMPYCMVMSNLCAEGFTMVDVSKGLDEAHCRLALRQLARFHGAGFALKQLRPDMFSEMRESLPSVMHTQGMRNQWKPFMVNLHQFPELAKAKYPEGSEVHAALVKLVDAFHRDVMAVMYSTDESGFTIIHGDCDAKNMLFLYDKDSGAVTTCKLLDFQTCFYNSPAADVSRLLHTCTDKAMRDQHCHDLIHVYFEELQTTMRMAGLPEPSAIYSWQLFQSQLRRAVAGHLYQGPLLYAILTLDEDFKEAKDALTDAERPNGDAPRKQIYLKMERPAVRDRFLGLLDDVVASKSLPTVDEIESWLKAVAHRQTSSL